MLVNYLTQIEYMKNDRMRNVIKFLLKNIVTIERDMNQLAEYCNQNESLFNIHVETKDIISFVKFSEVLELTDDKYCEKMYTEFSNLWIEEQLDNAIDIFIDKYIYR